VAGSMYYKSPEMLMDFMNSELSTDVWSLGCVFAALIYRTPIFFVGDNNMHQLITIADVRNPVQAYKCICIRAKSSDGFCVGLFEL
jgi:casein kinase II subunit alpha